MPWSAGTVVQARTDKKKRDTESLAQFKPVTDVLPSLALSLNCFKSLHVWKTPVLRLTGRTLYPHSGVSSVGSGSPLVRVPYPWETRRRHESSVDVAQLVRETRLQTSMTTVRFGSSAMRCSVLIMVPRGRLQLVSTPDEDALEAP